MLKTHAFEMLRCVLLETSILYAQDLGIVLKYSSGYARQGIDGFLHATIRMELLPSLQFQAIVLVGVLIVCFHLYNTS